MCERPMPEDFPAYLQNPRKSQVLLKFREGNLLWKVELPATLSDNELHAFEAAFHNYNLAIWHPMLAAEGKSKSKEELIQLQFSQWERLRAELYLQLERLGWEVENTDFLVGNSRYKDWTKEKENKELDWVEVTLIPIAT